MSTEGGKRTMGSKMKGRKPECPHLHTKTKTGKVYVETICKDCGMTLGVKRKPNR